MTKYRMKPGVGPHKIGRRTVTPGQSVECAPEDLGGARDKFIALTPEPGPEQFAPTVGLKAKHKGSGKWVVLNDATGVQIHDGYLTKEEAHAMATVPDAEGDGDEESPSDTTENAKDSDGPAAGTDD